MRYSQIDSHVRVPSLSRFPCFRTGTWPLNRSPSASEGGRGMKARILRILSCQEPDMSTIFSRVFWQIVKVICNMFHTHLYLKQIQTL